MHYALLLSQAILYVYNRMNFTGEIAPKDIQHNMIVNKHHLKQSDMKKANDANLSNL